MLRKLVLALTALVLAGDCLPSPKRASDATNGDTTGGTDATSPCTDNMVTVSGALWGDELTTVQNEARLALDDSSLLLGKTCLGLLYGPGWTSDTALAPLDSSSFTSPCGLAGSLVTSGTFSFSPIKSLTIGETPAVALFFDGPERGTMLPTITFPCRTTKWSQNELRSIQWNPELHRLG